MRCLILIFLFVASALVSCVVTPDPYGQGGLVVSPLPAVVEIGPDPFYYYNNTYYWYDNDNWRYSRSRSGPWTELPRSYWPKEVRHKGRNHDRDKRDFDQRRDRDYTNGRDYRPEFDRR